MLQQIRHPYFLKHQIRPAAFVQHADRLLIDAAQAGVAAASAAVEEGVVLIGPGHTVVAADLEGHVASLVAVIGVDKNQELFALIFVRDQAGVADGFGEGFARSWVLGPGLSQVVGDGDGAGARAVAPFGAAAAIVAHIEHERAVAELGDLRFGGIRFGAGSDLPGLAVIAAVENGGVRHFVFAFELSGKDQCAVRGGDAFAGALLLPKEVMEEELGQKRNKITEWELKKIKGIYGISIQAIMARACHLNIISEYTYRQFNIYVNKKGWRTSEPGSYVGREKANRFKQLVLHAAAEQIISFSKAAEFLNRSLEEFEKEVQIVS